MAWSRTFLVHRGERQFHVKLVTIRLHIREESRSRLVLLDEGKLLRLGGAAWTQEGSFRQWSRTRGQRVHSLAVFILITQRIHDPCPELYTITATAQPTSVILMNSMTFLISLRGDANVDKACLPLPAEAVVRLLNDSRGRGMVSEGVSSLTCRHLDMCIRSHFWPSFLNPNLVLNLTPTLNLVLVLSVLCASVRFAMVFLHHATGGASLSRFPR